MPPHSSPGSASVPDSPTGATAGARGKPGEEAFGGGETFGPVVFRRYVKDDGRALILYERRRTEDPGAEVEGSPGARGLVGAPAASASEHAEDRSA